MIQSYKIVSRSGTGRAATVWGPEREGAPPVLESRQTSRMNVFAQFPHLRNARFDKRTHIFFLPIWAAPEEAKTEALSQWSSFQTESKSAGPTVTPSLRWARSAYTLALPPERKLAT